MTSGTKGSRAPITPPLQDRNSSNDDHPALMPATKPLSTAAGGGASSVDTAVSAQTDGGKGDLAVERRLLLLQRLQIRFPRREFALDRDHVADGGCLRQQRPHPRDARGHALDPAVDIGRSGGDVLAALGSPGHLAEAGQLAQDGVVPVGGHPQADRELRSSTLCRSLETAGGGGDLPGRCSGSGGRGGLRGSGRIPICGPIAGRRDRFDVEPNVEIGGPDHLAVRRGGRSQLGGLRSGVGSLLRGGIRCRDLSGGSRGIDPDFRSVAAGRRLTRGHGRRLRGILTARRA